MDLQQKLNDAKVRKEKLIVEANQCTEQMIQLRDKKILLIQEALKCEGEVRTLQALIKEEKGKG